MTTFGNILRAKGRPRISMVVSLTNVLNAILSSLAIFVITGDYWGRHGYGFSSSGWDSDIRGALMKLM